MCVILQKAILDLLYELVGLPQPEWTDEISVALDAVDPSDFQVNFNIMLLVLSKFHLTYTKFIFVMSLGYVAA